MATYRNRVRGPTPDEMAQIIASKLAAKEQERQRIAEDETMVASKHARVMELIDASGEEPTIVNPESKFVVVTYWWGRGNLNKNTARPCLDFYEEIFDEAIKLLGSKPNLSNYREILDEVGLVDENGEHIPNEKKPFQAFLLKSGRKYINAAKGELRRIEKEKARVSTEITARPTINVNNLGLFVSPPGSPLPTQRVSGLPPRPPVNNLILSPNETTNNFFPLSGTPQQGGLVSQRHDPIANPLEVHGITSPEVFVRMVKQVLYDMIEFQENNKNPFKDLLRQYTLLQLMRLKLEKDADGAGVAESLEIVEQQKKLVKEKENLMKNLKEFVSKNGFPRMEGLFRFKAPLKYNQMIENWKIACEKSKCNYLAIEYPEFVGRDGYQLAINAKPRFIQKALQLCHPRNVLYIDGDMTINRYPTLFDTPDVDMMARGWNMDPRSSYKHKFSITVDPYIFETSGGTMFFSQSSESLALLDRWIHISEKYINWGKADDRILSLLFNTFRLLLPMKIIQLPIEYLWLTLDYDDSINEEYQNEENIFIEHPECLTSEDTAGGAGASSNRSPKFYAGLENKYPRSELLMEAVMFEHKKDRVQFETYLKYLKDAKYFDDYLDDCLYGQPAFNVIPFDKQFGKYTATFNANEAKLKKMMEEKNTMYVPYNKKANIQNINTTSVNVVRRMNEPSIQETDESVILRILFGLKQGRTVLYIPSNSSPEYLESIKNCIRNPKYSRIEFAFVNASKDVRDTFYFQSTMDTDQPMLFRPCRHLELLLQMCSNFQEMNKLFKNGYQFLSRIRTHYLMKAGRAQVQTGGGEENDSIAVQSDQALDILYSMNGGKSKKHMTRKRKTRSQRKYKTRKH
jgi:hypothetical protein